MASRARDLANLAKGNLTIDASGDLDVSGTLTADGLTVQSTSNDSTVNTIQLAPSTTTNVQGGLGVKSGGIVDVNGVNTVGLQVGGTRYLQASAGGDISFYDSTGVTQGFLWDASTQRLGLGTTAPEMGIHLSSSITNYLRVTHTSTGVQSDFGTSNTGTEIINRQSAPIRFHTNATERMRIDSDGKVGIGTSSPSAKLELNNGGAGSLVTFTDGVNTNFNFSTTSLLGTFGTDAGSTALAFKTTGTERMRIDSLGNLGIGMTNPNSYGRLAVMTPTTGYGYFGIGNSVSGGGGVNIGTYFGTARVSYMDTAVENGTAGSEQSRLTFGTALGGTLSEKMRIDSSGNLTATGNVTAYSDERLKSDITTIDNALDKVTAMRGVTFTKDGEASSGVIAQEIEKIAPELVMDGDYKSVAYGNLVGYLIEAVKELSAKVEELENASSK